MRLKSFRETTKCFWSAWGLGCRAGAHSCQADDVPVLWCCPLLLLRCGAGQGALLLWHFLHLLRKYQSGHLQCQASAALPYSDFSGKSWYYLCSQLHFVNCTSTTFQMEPLLNIFKAKSQEMHFKETHLFIRAIYLFAYTLIPYLRIF